MLELTLPVIMVLYDQRTKIVMVTSALCNICDSVIRSCGVFK